MDVSICSSFTGHVDAVIKHPLNGVFHFSGFYDNPGTSQHEHSWELLRLAKIN